MLRFTVTLFVLIIALFFAVALIGGVGEIELLIIIVVALALTIGDARRRKAKTAGAQTQ